MSSTWEYQILSVKDVLSFRNLDDLPDNSEAIDVINREGSRGWELVDVVSKESLPFLRMYFKRPR